MYKPVDCPCCTGIIPRSFAACQACRVALSGFSIKMSAGPLQHHHTMLQHKRLTATALKVKRAIPLQGSLRRAARRQAPRLNPKSYTFNIPARDDTLQSIQSDPGLHTVQRAAHNTGTEYEIDRPRHLPIAPETGSGRSLPPTATRTLEHHLR